MTHPDIAAAERRGAERMREAAAMACLHQNVGAPGSPILSDLLDAAAEIRALPLPGDAPHG